MRLWFLFTKAALRTSLAAVFLGTAFLAELAWAAESFSVATFNIENYIIAPGGARPVKSTQSRAKVRECILAMRPDVLGLQEIGDTNALMELRSALKTHGLEYPFWEHVAGYDTNIHVAVLSRFPIAARRSHSREGFLLNGRRFRTSRGIAEIDIQVNSKYSFTLFVAHLKSRRPSVAADETDIREQEALIVREKVDARLRGKPNANVLVLGDLNDIKNSISTRALIGTGRSSLIDTRPAERNGDPKPTAGSRLAPRNIVWTHFYGVEDSYSRVDYILLSRGMAREWDPAGSYVLTQPNWGLASDHRPVLAQFTAADK